MSDFEQDQVAIGATPISIVDASGEDKWLIIANNNIAGNPTGVAVTVQVTPVQGPNPVIPYGEVRHIHLKKIRWLQISGNGANASILLRDDDEPLQVTTVQPIANQNITINTDNVGLAKSSQLPVSLDGGNLRVNVEAPHTGGGSVQVHDIGT